jgi:TorA maturation chaperone TorD
MRARVYSLGQALTGAPPSVALLSRLCEDAALAVLAGELEPVARVRRGALACLRDAAARKEAEEEYARLYVGPRALPSPLWESVYRDPEHILFGEITLAVREWYARYGLVFSGRKTEPDDHIALELEFMWHLTARAARAARGERMLADGGAETALPSFVSLHRAQRDFLESHLLQWAPQSFAVQLPHACTDLYAGLAELIMEFLPSDASLLTEFLKRFDFGNVEPLRKDLPCKSSPRDCREADLLRRQATIASVNHAGDIPHELE